MNTFPMQEMARKHMPNIMAASRPRNNIIKLKQWFLQYKNIFFGINSFCKPLPKVLSSAGEIISFRTLPSRATDRLNANAKAVFFYKHIKQTLKYMTKTLKNTFFTVFLHVS